MSENNNSKLLMAFLAGAAVGAAIGYFLNSSYKDELVSDLKEGATNLKEGIDESLCKAKDIVDSLKNEFHTPEDEAPAQS
jgi:hypothetical protein